MAGNCCGVFFHVLIFFPRCHVRVWRILFFVRREWTLLPLFVPHVRVGRKFDPKFGGDSDSGGRTLFDEL
jgi:hypothetical protein